MYFLRKKSFFILLIIIGFLLSPKLVKAQQPIIQQNYFRWYVNVDNVDPTDPWPEGANDLGENTPITLSDSPPPQGTVLRIRMSLYVDPTGQPLQPLTRLKLQYGEKTGNSCSAITSWFDLAPPSSCTFEEWCGYDNSPFDGQPITQLLLSVSDVLETYEEENDAIVLNSVGPDQDGEWDWVIVNHNAKKNTSYCFRMVYSDGSEFDQYNYYPELTTQAITVSGTVYRWVGGAHTPIGPNKTVVIKVNGADKCNGTDPCTDETDDNGFYQITNLDIDATNDVLTVFLDGETEKAVTVTKARDPTSDITGLDLYENELIVRHEGDTAITNSDLGQYDKDDDSDIHFTSNDNTLVVDNDHGLFIWKNKTFSPNGPVTTNPGGTSPGGDLEIDNNATFIAGGPISVGGSWLARSGSTFNHNYNSVTFTATTTGNTIITNSQAFYDLVFNGSGNWTFNDQVIIDNDLIVTAGTISGTQNLKVNGGDIICDTSCGTINLTGGTLTLSGTGNFGTSNLTSDWTFYNLTFSGTTTSQGPGKITVSNVLTISANSSLDAGSKTWILSGNNIKPFVLNGNFIANTSTFTYTGDNPSGNTTITATTYNHLTIDNNSETYVLEGTTSVNGDLKIAHGTLDVTGANYNLNVKGSWTNNGNFIARSGTVTFNGTSSGKTINPGSSSFFNLTFDGSGGEWTLSDNDLDVKNNLTIINGTLNAGTRNITIHSLLEIETNGIFVKGSGTFTFADISLWIDKTESKQDLGNVVIAGGVKIGSSVKATRITIYGSLDLTSHGYTLNLTGSGIGNNKPLIIETGGTLIIGNSTVEYTGNSSADTEITLVSNYYNLKINGTDNFIAEAGSWKIDNNLMIEAGTFNLGGPTTVAHNLSIGSSGILDVVEGQNHDLTVGGSWINSGGTFYARSGKVIFNSNSSETITTGHQPFYNLTFNNSGTWTMQDALDVNGSFNLSAGTFIQADNHNINFGGNVIFKNGTTFIKANGNGLVIFDGNNAIFRDENKNNKQNLGNVQVGTSPDDITLCSDTFMDSLTVNSGDTFYLNKYNLKVTNSITVNSNGTLDASTTRPDLCPPGPNDPDIYLGTDWTVDNNGIFLAGHSTVIFDGTSDGNLQSGGIDDHHKFYNLTIEKSSSATVTLINHLNVRGNLNIANINSTLRVSSYPNPSPNYEYYDIYLGGNWSNAGYFLYKEPPPASGGKVIFDADSTGKTIDTGGTGNGKKFRYIIFDNPSGGWTIINNDLVAEYDFTLKNASVFDATGRQITVNGIFTNSVGGNATTWTNSVLFLSKTGGGSYSINSRTDNGDDYHRLKIGLNTHIRMWYSAACDNVIPYSLEPSGSIYSQDADSNCNGLLDPDEDGRLEIFGDYHTTDSSTDYWTYDQDFDGTTGANRQVKVYLLEAGGIHPSVTVDNFGTLIVKGGGNNINDITIVGQDASDWWNFACFGTCKVQESRWNYLKLTGGNLTVINTTFDGNQTVAGGTLNVDWYLGVYLVDRADLSPINTHYCTDIVISENSSSASTVWKWSGNDWDEPSSSKSTGTGPSCGGQNGKIPQPGTNGAIRIREYTRTNSGYTFYKYNLYINWQNSTYGEYDYYRGYGKKYITSTLNTGSGEDECISQNWVRYDIDVQNEPEQAIDDPPTNGTWYNGMISGLSFSVAGVTDTDCPIIGGAVKKTTTSTNISYGIINPENFYDACQSLTVSTSASEGYIVTIHEIDQLTSGSYQIPDGNCDGSCSETNSAPWNIPTNNGFAYCMKDINGNPAATAQPINWTSTKQCGGSSQSFMIIPEKDVDQPDRIEIMKNSGPTLGDESYIGFRLSIDATQPPGFYSTTIIYIITPLY